MINARRVHRPLQVCYAVLQLSVSLAAFVMVAVKIIPAIFSNVAAEFPPFSVGSFTSDFMFFAIAIHVTLLVLFGVDFWSRAFGIAAQLAVLLVFFGVALQGAFELVSLGFHKLHVADSVPTPQLPEQALITLTALQQPLFVVTVLPPLLACLNSLQSLVDHVDAEALAARALRREGHVSILGFTLASIYFFARCCTHVSHFVIPMTSQVLREERFQEELTNELKRALRLILLPEAVISSVWHLINRLGRAACGSLLLGIEYIPMWSAQVATVLLRGANDNRG